MINNSASASIVEKISQSKKYKKLYAKTIERVGNESIEKYGLKMAEEKTRNKLHQIWGAYYSFYPNFHKIEEKYKQSLQNIPLKEALLPILSLHTSTNERIPILHEFYKSIFAIIGKPASIIDHACGLHPLAIPWMQLEKEITYAMYDIDEEQTKFLRDVIVESTFGVHATIETQDIFCNTFPFAEVVFMLKLLPVLEQQKKDSSLAIMKQQQCKFLVVSFPVKTIGGKEKGMMDFYTQKFLQNIKKENWEYHQLVFPTELVFVIKKQ